MARQTNYFYRGLIDFPSAAIVVGWIGLWFLWPSAATSKARPSAFVGATYFVQMPVLEKTYVQPDTFRKPMDAAGARADEPGAIIERLTGPVQRAPRYLEKPPGADAAFSAELESVVPAELGHYAPLWNEELQTAVRPATREMKLFSTLQGGLVESGFAMASFSVEELKRFDKPWQVVMYVEVNDDGRVENVLLENGPDDTAVTAAAIRAAYRSSGKPGTGYSGRLTLSYGFP